jgi:hypothetical protein
MHLGMQKQKLTNEHYQNWVVYMEGLINLDIASWFRHPNFVVNKGLLILEEELVMYLPLLLNKKNALTNNAWFHNR